MRPLELVPLPLIEEPLRGQRPDAYGGACCSCLTLVIIGLVIAVGIIYSLANP